MMNLGTSPSLCSLVENPWQWMHRFQGLPHSSFQRSCTQQHKPLDYLQNREVFTITFSPLSCLEVAFTAKQMISGALTFNKNGNIMRHHETSKTVGYSGSRPILVIHGMFSHQYITCSRKLIPVYLKALPSPLMCLSASAFAKTSTVTLQLCQQLPWLCGGNPYSIVSGLGTLLALLCRRQSSFRGMRDFAHIVPRFPARPKEHYQRKVPLLHICN